MSRKWSKRKRPDRNIHLIKEQEKTDEGIFNRRIMIYLSKFYNKGVVEKVDFVVARGKEAEVYVADAGESELVEGEELIALKFFRVETSTFYKMKIYIEGDPRFGMVRGSRSGIVNIWCKKEFGNLKLANKAGVNAPKPFMFHGSILAMEFIGSESGVPAPKLKDVVLDDPEKMFKEIIKQTKLLYKGGLVHADLSEYNILVKDSEPFFIDMGQSVILRHPGAVDFLKRDIHNISRYFSSKYGLEADEKKILDQFL